MLIGGIAVNLGSIYSVLESDLIYIETDDPNGFRNYLMENYSPYIYFTTIGILMAIIGISIIIAGVVFLILGRKKNSYQSDLEDKQSDN